ncbi:hypothetical protein ACEN88_26145 [Massilia sp. CT11-108]|uniref:hypothetical protein n=1 Tax=Massilia sp. CT11-108 TaxID=3393900 RepID=UPI0039A639C1
MEPSKPIELPFTRDSVIHVLTYGANPETSPYSHRQIAEWCDRFWCQYLNIDAEPSIEALLHVLTDIETQWDLYLSNTYSIEELRSKSFDSETMPVQWFRDWLKQIEK